MDILVTHVYDKCRFGYYMEAKFQMHKLAAVTMANDIDNGYFVKLCDLPECDVRYLQRTGYHCNNNLGNGLSRKITKISCR